MSRSRLFDDDQPIAGVDAGRTPPDRINLHEEAPARSTREPCETRDGDCRTRVDAVRVFARCAAAPRAAEPLAAPKRRRLEDDIVDDLGERSSGAAATNAPNIGSRNADTSSSSLPSVVCRT